MTWHAAGTYRIADGRGGRGRKRRSAISLHSTVGPYNRSASTRLAASSGRSRQKVRPQDLVADLLIFTGNRAIETMGPQDVRFRRRTAPTSGTPREDVYWGPETGCGSKISDTAATASWPIPLAPSRWVSSMSNPEGPERPTRIPMGVGPRHPARPSCGDGDETTKRLSR